MASSGNFCTINPVGAQGGGTTSPSTLSSGNTAATIQTDTLVGTVGVTSGKWYGEWALTGSSTSGMAVGWANQQVNTLAELGYNSPSSATGAQIVYMYLSKNPPEIISDAPKSASAGTDTSMSEISQNDILGLAADFDNDKWYFSINGSFTDVRSGQDPATGSNPLCSASSGGGLVTISRTAGYTWFPAMGNWAASTRDIKVNFGQDSTFSGSFSAGGNTDDNGFGDFKYSVPTGFLAMCSGNLPIGTDIDPAGDDGADNNPKKQFFMTEYLGNLTNRTVTTENQADLILIRHTNFAQNWYVVDSNRGITNNYYLKLDDTVAEATFPQSNFQSIGSTSVGISSGTWLNSTSAYYQMWMWHCNSGTTTSDSSGDITVTRQTNDASKFSILTYTGSGSSGNTIAHGLGVKPAMTWIKQRNSSNGWNVWHQGYNSGDYDSFGELNSSGSWNANQGSNGPFTAAPGTDYLTLTAYGQVNGSSNTYVCYTWADVEGMQKFGNYAGNGNADGPFIYTGFRPRMLFLKSTDTSDDWIVIDTLRSTFNVTNNGLAFNNNNAETTSNRECDILSNGFKPKTSNTNLNKSGTNYIYGAWGDVPFKYNNTF